MDGSKFDVLTRNLAHRKTRRGVLAGIGATAMAGALGLFSGDAEARSICRPEGVVCSKNADCCLGLCAPKDNLGRRYCAGCPDGGEACGSNCCFGGEICVEGSCQAICTPAGGPCDLVNPAVCCSQTCGNGEFFPCGNFAACCISTT